MIWQKWGFTSLVFFKTHNPNLIWKNKTNTGWGAFYRIPENYYARLSSSWKTDRNIHRAEETEETWQLNAVWYPWLDPRRQEMMALKTDEIQVSLEYS